MLLSVVSVLVVAQSSSEIPEGLMNNPVPHRKLGGPQGQSGQLRKFSPSTGIGSTERPATSQASNV